MLTCDEAHPLLDAYVDGELDAAGNLALERHLETCPVCARGCRERQGLAGSLQAPGLRHALPAAVRQEILDRLRAEARAAAPRPELEPEPGPGARTRWAGPRSPVRLGWLALAAAAVFVCGGLVASRVFWPRPGSEDAVAREVFTGHLRSLLLAENHLVDVASSDRHTVKPWFNGKLDFAPPVADFAAQGFPLVGGRLDYLDARPVAALVYRRRQHAVTLFVWPDAVAAGAAADQAPTSPRALTRQGYHLCGWTQGGMHRWVISDLNPEELQQFVTLLRDAAPN